MSDTEDRTRPSMRQPMGSFAGNWSASSFYGQGTLVTEGEGLYIATADNIGKKPNESEDVWRKVGLSFAIGMIAASTWFGPGVVNAAAIENEAVTQTKAALASNPAIPAEGLVTVGTPGIARIVVAKIKGDGAKTKFKVKHGITGGFSSGTTAPAVCFYKEGELVTVTALKVTVKLTSATELEVTFEVAPIAGADYVVSVLG